MNKQLNINLYFDDKGEDIKDILTRDFKEFLNSYIKKVLKQFQEVEVFRSKYSNKDSFLYFPCYNNIVTSSYEGWSLK